MREMTGNVSRREDAHCIAAPALGGLCFIPWFSGCIPRKVKGSPESAVPVSLRVIEAVPVLAEHELEGLTGGVRR